MGKKIIKRYPKYLNEFKCIGGKCEDSCCVGWDIDIDKTTFKRYHKVQHGEMKKMFQKNLHNNENYFSVDVDYGKVKLKSGKRCPFLDTENYCMVYSNLGEDYLSNVCTAFPRVTNKVDNNYEMSLDVACPEAARILLLKEEGIHFNESNEGLGKHIISNDIDTKHKGYNESYIKYLKEIREVSIKIIQNRSLTLDKRLYILGEFINALEDEVNYNYNNVSKFIKSYDINLIKDDYEENNMKYLLQMDFFKKMVNILNVEKDVDSLSFKEYTNELMAGFNLKEDENISKNSELYIKAFNNYIDKYIHKHSYIFENYLVNFMYMNMFPLYQEDSIFHGYIMLLTRYSFIRFYLVGRYLNNNNDSKEDIVRFIQGFSKTIEHHKTYLNKSLNYIKKNEFDNIEFAKVLL